MQTAFWPTVDSVNEPLSLVVVSCGEDVPAPAAAVLMPELPLVYSTVLISRLASPADTLTLCPKPALERRLAAAQTSVYQERHGRAAQVLACWLDRSCILQL